MVNKGDDYKPKYTCVNEERNVKIIASLICLHFLD